MPAPTLRSVERLEDRTTPAVVSVDAGSVVRTAPDALLGTNLAYYDARLTVHDWNTDTVTGIDTQTQAKVQDVGLNTFRLLSGGDSQRQHFFQRVPGFQTASYLPSQARFAASVGGTMVFSTNYGSGSPEEGAAMLAYLNAAPTNPTVLGPGSYWDAGAGNAVAYDWKTAGYWAGLRAANPLAVDDGLNFLRIGRAAPFGAQYAEVGNEPWGGFEFDYRGADADPTTHPHDPVQYVEHAKEFAALAEQISPGIQVGVSIIGTRGDFGTFGGGDWTPALFTQLAAQNYTPDFVFDHYYPVGSPLSSLSDQNILSNTVSSQTAETFTGPANLTRRHDATQNLLTATIGASKAAGVDILLTEFHLSGDKVTPTFTALTGGLWVADVLGEAGVSGYDAALMWNLRNSYGGQAAMPAGNYGWRDRGDYGILGDYTVESAPQTGAYIAYPSYFGQKLAGQLYGSGNSVLRVTTDSPATLTAYATRGTDGKLRLLVINKDAAADISTSFTISGFTPAGPATFSRYGKPNDEAQRLSADGAASLTTGTLTVGGTTFTLTVPSYSMTVFTLEPATGTAPTITSGTPPLALTVGTPYAFQFAATGSPVPTFSAVGLPAGLSLTDAGLLSGTPVAEGAFPVTMTAANGVSPAATQSFTLTVNPAPPVTVPPAFTSGQPPAATAGAAYTFAFTATGTPAPTFALAAGAQLPPGLTLSADGLLSGAPQVGGTFAFTVVASNGVAPDASFPATLVVNVAPPAGVAPAFTSPPAPTGTTGVPYSFRLTATGVPAAAFVLSTGATLPPGLALALDGTLSGTPTVAGTFAFGVVASNTAGSATQAVTLTVVAAQPPGTPPAFVSAASLLGSTTAAFAHTFAASGNPAPTFALAPGSQLPPGLTLSAAGVLSGTPTRAGLFPFAVVATNAAGSATQAVTLEVVTPTPVPIPVVPRPRDLLVSADGGVLRAFRFDGGANRVALTLTPFPGFTGSVRAASADVDGDGTPDTVAVTGPGGGALVRIYSGATGADLLAGGAFDAYAGEDFTRIGLFVAAADVDGDGRAEVAVSPDRGGGARVQLFRLVDGVLVQAANFFAIDDPSFRGGGRIALGDLDGDRRADLITGAGFGGGPRVALFDGRSLGQGVPRKLVGDFFMFEPALRDGLFAAAGDVDGDGTAELVFGGGPGGGPRVQVLRFADVARDPANARNGGIANFFAFDAGSRGGVRVGAADYDGDGRADILAASGDRAAPAVTVFAGGSALAALTPFDAPSLANGIFVG